MQCADYYVATLGAVRVTILFHKMKFIDIHTHNRNRKDFAILNCDIKDIDSLPCSIGIHPWDIDSLWQEKFNKISECAKKGNIAAIGECGFDFLKSSASRDLQADVFKAHIELSELTEKPLVIHLVKGIEYLMNISRSIPHKQAWIIHGFRGKPEQAQQLLSHGLYLSFGNLFNEKSIETTPIERILIETDESEEEIEKTYKLIAEIKGIAIEQLCLQISENAKRCKIFFL